MYTSEIRASFNETIGPEWYIVPRPEYPNHPPEYAGQGRWALYGDQGIMSTDSYTLDKIVFHIDFNGSSSIVTLYSEDQHTYISLLSIPSEDSPTVNIQYSIVHDNHNIGHGIIFEDVAYDLYYQYISITLLEDRSLQFDIMFDKYNIFGTFTSDPLPEELASAQYQIGITGEDDTPIYAIGVNKVRRPALMLGSEHYGWGPFGNHINLAPSWYDPEYLGEVKIKAPSGWKSLTYVDYLDAFVKTEDGLWTSILYESEIL